MSHNRQDNSTDSVVNPSINTDKDHENDSTDAKPPNQLDTDNNDEFIRVTAAHQMLIEAQTYDEQKNYPVALQLYRICVDFLLEELMFAEGTEQSRIYLRQKSTAIMDRIDILKTKLEPIPTSIAPELSNTTLPIDQLKSLDLS